jgi:hypothetical protein
MASRVTGSREVSADIRASVRRIPALALAEVNKAAEAARARVIDEVAANYNVGREQLTSYVSVRRASPGSAKVSASVQIQIKAIPLETFNPQVRMEPVQVRARNGRSFLRQLPRIYSSFYRGQATKLLKGAFPLRQRSSGVLKAGDRARKRINTSTNPVENRRNLKRFRYYTFPKRLLDPLLVRIEASAPEGLDVSFRAAFRYSSGKLAANR